MGPQQEPRLLELGDFLCTRRARLTPEDVGLPTGADEERQVSGVRKWLKT